MISAVTFMHGLPKGKKKRKQFQEKKAHIICYYHIKKRGTRERKGRNKAKCHVCKANMSSGQVPDRMPHSQLTD